MSSKILSMFLLFSLFLLTKSYTMFTSINRFHNNHTDNDTDDEPEPSSIPDKKDDKKVKINGYFFKNFPKSTSTTFKIIPSDYNDCYIILVCSKENTMTVENSEHSITTRLFLIDNYNLEHEIILKNEKEDFFFEVSFIPKLYEVNYFRQTFEKEYHKLFSPQNYIYILVDYIMFKENSILYYDPYISYPKVKYVPLKENTKFHDIFYSEVESHDFIYHSYIPKDNYFIIKIKTNSSYDFYFGLKDEFLSTTEQKFFLLPTHYRQVLLQENQVLHIDKINKDCGISVSLIAQSNPDFKLYVNEYYSSDYLNYANREKLICCSTVAIQALNGYGLVALLESAPSFGDYSIQYYYYDNTGGIAPYQNLPLFESYEGKDYINYNILGFKILITHSGKIKCHIYNLGGCKQRGYYTGQRGISKELSFTGWENFYYYYPSDVINENSFGDGQYAITLFCPCCNKYTADYSFKLNFIYYNENNFKFLNEKSRNLIYNNSNFDDYDNVTYKINPPKNIKNKNQILKIELSNCRNNYYNFHLLSQFNISYYTYFSAYKNEEILIPIKFDDFSNLNNLYVYFENFVEISFEYEYIELNEGYEIKYTFLDTKFNLTINKNGNHEIKFYPIIFGEDMEYKIYILEHEKNDISKKCVFNNYINNNYNNLKDVDLGSFIVHRSDINYTIISNFEYKFENKDYYSIVLSAYQKENSKFKYLYDINYYLNPSKDGTVSEFFQENKIYIIIGSICFVVIIAAFIIAIIAIKKRKNSEKNLKKDVEEFKQGKDFLIEE